jgi:endogenous inhibitor of DNA gyrase (YacG/DUF329 family)
MLERPAMEDSSMVCVTCPWCEEDARLVLAEVQEAQASFDCAECGTRVDLVEESPVPLDLAA